MVELNNSLKQCSICKVEYTSIHTEITPGMIIYVCSECLETAKHNFIWLCISCGKSYFRPKKLVIDRIDDFELKRAYMLCEDKQIVQGIDMCIECDSEGIVKYMNSTRTEMEC
jgi:hypothetical protein